MSRGADLLPMRILDSTNYGVHVCHLVSFQNDRPIIPIPPSIWLRRRREIFVAPLLLLVFLFFFFLFFFFFFFFLFFFFLFLFFFFYFFFFDDMSDSNSFALEAGLHKGYLLISSKGFLTSSVAISIVPLSAVRRHDRGKFNKAECHVLSTSRWKQRRIVGSGLSSWTESRSESIPRLLSDFQRKQVDSNNGDDDYFIYNVTFVILLM